MSTQVEQLQKENAELRQRIDDLEYMLTHASDKQHAKSLCLKEEFGLTPAEARVLALLASGKLVNHDQMLSTCRRMDPDPRTPAVLIRRIRAKLPHLEIKTVWGAGYLLQPEAKVIVDEAIERHMPRFANAKDPYFALI